MLVDHVGQGVVDQVEGGVQLGADADLPVLRLHLLDVARPGSGGVVDQDVQAAPLLNGGVHQLLAVLQLGDVGVDREGFAPGSDDVGVGVDGLGGGFRVPDDGESFFLSSSLSRTVLPSWACMEEPFLRLLVMTLQPWEAIQTARSFPIPWPEPVMIATRPFNRLPIVFLLIFLNLRMGMRFLICYSSGISSKGKDYNLFRISARFTLQVAVRPHG